MKDVECVVIAQHVMRLRLLRLMMMMKCPVESRRWPSVNDTRQVMTSWTTLVTRSIDHATPARHKLRLVCYTYSED